MNLSGLRIGLHIALFLVSTVRASEFRRVGNLRKDGQVVSQGQQLNEDGNNQQSATKFPLTECQGDCARDSDCQEGLQCFQRNLGELQMISDCEGDSEIQRNFFCYDPMRKVLDSTRLPSLVTFPRQLADAHSNQPLAFVGNDRSPASAFPLSKCQGDCDEDSDCVDGLKCFKRDSSILNVPGCDGNVSDDTDFCYDPADVLRGEETLVVKGNDQKPSRSYPLGLCEGDCDGDTDCAGNLVCYQTDGRKPIPSCSGRPASDTDYCIHPDDETAHPPVKGAFRLKKYWEIGFEWQEETWEQEWCMQCGGTGCNVGDEIFIRTCRDKNTWFVYANQESDGRAQLKVANSNLCLQWVDARDVRVRNCNANEPRQKFRALNGSFGGPKFEISTAKKEGCLTQHHHPKDGEKIFRSDCGTTRTYDTSFWTEY